MRADNNGAEISTQAQSLEANCYFLSYVDFYDVSSGDVRIFMLL